MRRITIFLLQRVAGLCFWLARLLQRFSDWQYRVAYDINPLSRVPMPWCGDCQCYHHETATCIRKIAEAEKSNIGY